MPIRKNSAGTSAIGITIAAIIAPDINITQIGTWMAKAI
jgi:hypothetical protein